MNNNNNNNKYNSRNGNGTTQACAACKYQRRKCAPDCILAPYFPHDRQRQFLNAHKLFGVSNITKIIKYLDPHDKDQAMRTIMYQSDMRANDPVGGCYRYIQDLQTQIEYHRAELELVLQQLAVFRAQQAQQQQQSHNVYNPAAMTNVNAVVNGDEIMNASDPLSLYNGVAPHYLYVQQVPQQDQQYMMLQETNDNNNTALQEHVNAWAMQNSMSLSALSLQGENSHASAGDEYDHKSMFDISDERNELGFEPQDLVHPSDDAVLCKIDDAVIKAEADCIQQAQDHDLKDTTATTSSGAPSQFVLTPDMVQQLLTAAFSILRIQGSGLGKNDHKWT